EELRDLTSYLSRLTGVKAGAADASLAIQPSDAPQIGFDRIRNPRPGDWPTYNGNLNGNRYSELSQINAKNVHKLAVKWIFPIDHFGLEVTPVVADGVMYVTGPNQALAMDALTGRVVWKY